MEMLRMAVHLAAAQHELLQQEFDARSRDREQKHEENMQKLRASRPDWGADNRHARRVAARRERQRAKV
jgi:hypothetical protein